MFQFLHEQFPLPLPKRLVHSDHVDISWHTNERGSVSLTGWNSLHNIHWGTRSSEWRRKMKYFTGHPFALSFLFSLSHHFLHSPLRLTLSKLSLSPFVAAQYTFHSRLASHTPSFLTLTCNTHTLPSPSQVYFSVCVCLSVFLQQTFTGHALLKDCHASPSKCFWLNQRRFILLGRYDFNRLSTKSMKSVYKKKIYGK